MHAKKNLFIYEGEYMADYVVIARFDEKTDRRVTYQRNMPRGAGYIVPEWPPHVTIAAYENLYVEPLNEWTSEFVSKNASVKSRCFQ
jgi:hypothetical protein